MTFVRRGRSRVVVGRTQRRKMTWIGFNLSVTVPASSVVLMGTFNAAALGDRPFTIVRTRAMLHVLSDQAAVTESPFGAIGAMIISDQASAVGITAIPDPVANSDAPWFLWEPWSLQFNFLSSVGFDANAGYSRMIDSKSMRKVNDNEDLAIVATNSVAEGAIVRFIGRMLIKLH